MYLYIDTHNRGTLEMV